MNKIYSDLEKNTTTLKRMIPTYRKERNPEFVINNVLPVYKNPPAISCTGAVIACISISNETLTPFIAIDNLFDKLSDMTKLFVIYHEIGHFANGDFSIDRGNYKYKLKTYFYEKIKQVECPRENQADYYAASKLDSMPDSLAALDEIKNTILDLYNENVTDEKKKTKAIKRLEKSMSYRKERLKELMLTGPYYISEESKEYNFSETIKNTDIQEEFENNLDKSLVDSLNLEDSVDENLEEASIINN